MPSQERYDGDEPVIRLDLGKQRLLIKPDDPLPKFYPRPKAIMLIPIYEDADVLLGPTVVSQSEDSRYVGYYPASSGNKHPQQQRQQQGQKNPETPPNKLRRRYSSYSPPPSGNAPQKEGEGGHQNGLYHPSGSGGGGGHQSSNGIDSRHNEDGRVPHTSPGKLSRPGRTNSGQHPPRRPSDSRYNGETPPTTPGGTGSPQEQQQIRQRGQFLQELKARRETFHEAVRSYFKVLPPNPRWARSNCTGKKKAVCIGINYIGQKNELKGCANDARSIREFLIQQYGFSSSNILMLTDDDKKNRMPTRDEMLKAFEWLVNGAQKHDSLFFHYSGHGGQVKDSPGGREIDGMDEVIFPVDHKQAGEIIDNELHDRLVTVLPPGCRLTAIFDSCHSGTVLDLPYIHSAHGRLRGLGHVSKRARKRGAADGADVICFSACTDDETAADTFAGNVAVGAMSHAFVETLEKNRHLTYDALLARLREILIPKYKQKAQISCTQPVELEREFTL